MKNAVRTIILLALLLMPNVYAMVTATNLNYSVGKEVAYLAVVLLSLALPATLLKARAYFIFEGVVQMLFFPFEMASLYLNGLTINYHFLDFITLTNIHEATELAGSLWFIPLAVVLIWILYFTLAAKVDNKFLIPAKTRKAVWIGIPLLFIAGMIALSRVSDPNTNEKSARKRLELVFETTLNKFEKIYPYDVYLSIWQLHEYRERIRKMEKQIASFSFNLQADTSAVRKHYVLVLGEALRADHLHLNGYERNTTPMLDSVKGLVSFTKMYSQANLTSQSLPLIVSRADVQHRDIAYTEKSLPEAFAEAGYKTAWISNHEASAFTRRISNKLDYQFYTTDTHGIIAFDTILIRQLSEFLKQHADVNTMTVVHCIGSHFKYCERYPDEYNVFSPAMSSADGYAILSPEHKNKIINAYDNTVLYEDYVWANLIKTLDSADGECVLMFISDHGENLVDDENNLILHGTYIGTQYEAHVPLLVWVNRQFKEAHPKETSAMLSNSGKQLSSDVVFHSFTGIGGFQSITDSTKNIFSPALAEKDTILMLTGSERILNLSHKTSVK